MIRFDRLKLLTKNYYIKRIDECKLKTLYDTMDLIEVKKYRQKSPFFLSFDKIYQKEPKLIIEFSAKILYDNYIDLINKNNIRQCFENINKLKIIELDIDRVLNDCEVLSCEITKDFNAQMFDIKDYVILNMKDNTNWTVKTPQYKNNIIIQNELTSNPKRITFYEKDKELKMASNEKFFNLLKDRKNKVIDYFDRNNIRAELKVVSKKQIRNMLKIENTQLSAVLNSDVNPIYDLLCETVKPISELDRCQFEEPQTIKELERLAVIEKFQCDMKLVEQYIRGMLKKNKSTVSFKRTIKPYHYIYERIVKNNVPRIDLHKLLGAA